MSTERRMTLDQAHSYLKVRSRLRCACAQVILTALRPQSSQWYAMALAASNPVERTYCVKRL